MANKLTDRSTFASTIANNDLIHIVDVSDSSQDPAGSSYKLQAGQLMTYINANVAVNNGLTNNLGTLQLGGALIQDTNITGAYQFNIENLSQFFVTSVSGTNTGYTYNSPTDNELGWYNASFETLLASTQNKATLASIAGVNQSSVNAWVNAQTIADGSVNNYLTVLDQRGSKGLVYSVDYSANFTDLSLVNKSYVTGNFQPVIGYTPVNKAGDTMLGTLVLNSDATTGLQAVTYQQLVGAITGVFQLQQGYNASTNLFPVASQTSPVVATIKKGFVWNITVGGTFPGGQVCQAGDTITALVDNPGVTAANWLVTEHDLGFTPISNVLNSANILVGNASNVAASVTMSGDVTITNAGVMAIGASKVTNAMLAGSIDLTSKVTGILPAANGGTGVNNTGTITVGGNVTFSGAFPTTLTVTAATSVILPITGTLATLAGSETFTNKTLSTGTKILLGSDVTGDIYYNSGSGTTARLAAGTSGYVLKSNGPGAAPSYQAEAGGLSMQPFFSNVKRMQPYAVLSTTTGLSGNVFYSAYFTGTPHTVKSIDIEVTGAVAASNVKLCLYADDGTGKPGALIETSGDISAATTGTKSYSFSSPIALTAQVYWLALQASSGSIQVRYISTGIIYIYNPATSISNGYIQAQSYGAFPSSATPVQNNTSLATTLTPQ